jgi:hypothetical protein
MEPEDSLPLSQESATDPYPELLLIVSSHLLLRLPSVPSGFPTKILYAFLISPMRASFPTHLILLDLSTLIVYGEEYHYAAFSDLCFCNF